MRLAGGGSGRGVAIEGGDAEAIASRSGIGDHGSEAGARSHAHGARRAKKAIGIFAEVPR
jgi:hypothetical protein